jgi:hypothetical protein
MVVNHRNWFLFRFWPRYIKRYQFWFSPKHTLPKHVQKQGNMPFLPDHNKHSINLHTLQYVLIAQFFLICDHHSGTNSLQIISQNEQDSGDIKIDGLRCPMTLISSVKIADRPNILFRRNLTIKHSINNQAPALAFEIILEPHTMFLHNF